MAYQQGGVGNQGGSLPSTPLLSADQTTIDFFTPQSLDHAMSLVSYQNVAGAGMPVSESKDDSMFSSAGTAQLAVAYNDLDQVRRDNVSSKDPSAAPGSINFSGASKPSASVSLSYMFGLCNRSICGATLWRWFFVGLIVCVLSIGAGILTRYATASSGPSPSPSPSYGPSIGPSILPSISPIWPSNSSSITPSGNATVTSSIMPSVNMTSSATPSSSITFTSSITPTASATDQNAGVYGDIVNNNFKFGAGAPPLAEGLGFYGFLDALSVGQLVWVSGDGYFEGCSGANPEVVCPLPGVLSVAALNTYLQSPSNVLISFRTPGPFSVVLQGISGNRMNGTISGNVVSFSQDSYAEIKYHDDKQKTFEDARSNLARLRSDSLVFASASPKALGVDRACENA